MRRHWFPKSYAGVVQRLRVPSGLALAAAYAWMARPARWSLIAGAVVSAIGLGVRAWSAAHLEKNQHLAADGPYAWVRNPLYIGSLIAAAGLAMASREPWIAAMFAAMFAMVYLPAIEQEEQHLRNLFPDYEAYAARVPMLWPRWPGESRRSRASWPRYLRNREYQALIAWLAAMALLWWKLPA
jgi:protein-S-isoprenylcysteine O-methyltransferase Ste14